MRVIVDKENLENLAIAAYALEDLIEQGGDFEFNIPNVMAKAEKRLAEMILSEVDTCTIGEAND